MSTHIPRASISVSILDDEDYISLMQTDGGPQAFGVFVALIVAAKSRKNGGIFKTSDLIISSWIRVNSSLLLDSILIISAVCKANGNKPWIERVDGVLYIRNYEKWNSWGGKRDGAGRPITAENNQDGIKSDSSHNQDGNLGGLSDSVSDTDSELKPKTKYINPSTADAVEIQKTPTIDLKRKPKQVMSDESLAAFETFWNAFPRRVGKGAARRAWAKIPKANWEAVQQGCLKYSRLRESEDPKFTVHPATWLNQERWLDENDLLDADGLKLGARGVRYDPNDFKGGF